LVGKTGLLPVILCPPFYPRNPVPTPSEPFCFPVHSRKQAFAVPGKTKPAAIAAGFLFVGTVGQMSNLLIDALKAVNALVKELNTIALCPNCRRKVHLSKDRDIFKNEIYQKVERLIK